MAITTNLEGTDQGGVLHIHVVTDSRLKGIQQRFVEWLLCRAIGVPLTYRGHHVTSLCLKLLSTAVCD